ncbi:GNAT family N-acetyltransferase, partial [Solemya velum gill symbiont]
SSALATYQRWGMVITGELVTDIGNGFVMDDYCLEKQLGN